MNQPKKYNFLCICLLYSVILIGQVNKVELSYFPHSKQVSERYSLSKKTGLKDGSYISYFQVSKLKYDDMKKGSINDSNLIKEKGFYKNGEKDGLWIEYTAPFSGQIKSTGIYKDGSKTGIWKTYIEHGNIIQRYDYDSNKYLPNQLNLYLSIAVAYPEKSREAGIQGTVVVNYSVENDCSIDSIMVINSVSKDCDDAVIDVVKQYGGLYKTYHQKYNIPCKPEKSVPFSVKFQFR